MPHKLQFHIAHVTSEGESGRARDLLQQGPGARGWVSAPFCTYPQQVIIRLQERSHLSKLQLLAHQHLIPERIDLYIGDVEEDKDVALHNASFTLLGHLKLSDNTHSKYKARELKSVTLSCTGIYLKLTLHKNHVNRLNLYNQVGLVGVNVLGNEVEDNNNSVSPDGEGGQVPGGQKGGDVPLYHDLAFSMYVDAQVAETIKVLEERKAVALAEKRDQYATRLSAAVTQLRTAGERLGKYEIEKRHAIDTEHYTRAKEKKEQAERYREEVYRDLNIEELLEPKGKLATNDTGANSTPHPSTLPPPYHPRPSSPSPDTPPSPPTHLPPARYPHTPPRPPPSPPRSPSPPPLRPPTQPLPQVGGGGGAMTPRPPPSPRHTYNSYDERTLPALKHRDVDERGEDDPSSPLHAPRRPPALSEGDRNDAALPIDVFGSELVEKVYSKNYSEKEAGLSHLHQLLMNYTPEDTGVRPDRFVRAAVVVVRRGLRDKVFSVGQRAAHTLTHIITSFVSEHRVTRKEVAGILDKVLPDLLAKMADNAPRTQQLASSTVLTLLQYSLERGVGSVGVEVTRPLTNSVHPRAALCRATLMEKELQALGVEELPREKESGFSVKQVVEFSHSAFRHQNSEVRKVGERLLLLLHPHHAPAVRRVLPPPDDVQRRSVHYRNLMDQLDAIDEKREAPPPPSGVGRGGATPPHKASPPSTSTTPPSQRTDHHNHHHHYHHQAPPSPPQPSPPPPPPHHLGAMGGGGGLGGFGGAARGGGAPLVCVTPEEVVEVRGRALSRLNGSCVDLTSDLESLTSPGDPDDRTCIFCGVYDEAFTDEGGLDLHYWRACPMLTRCANCRQVVEVASLTHHLLGECSASTQYRRCERCSEAIAKKVFQTHALAKTCTPSRPEPLANHCPLCHENIPPWEDGWRGHLLPGPDACLASPRAWPGVKKSQGASTGSGGVGGRKPGGAATPGTPRRSVSKRR
ncbi:centrosomal protein of 104 kDa-like isoform X2 [Eriocheir sinensis]|uniref:centrosomal protein of 104 kDa-like isoform X2 n=1 Tax=Eriocheir sinensis TaxID=95602 RepID=UPI0021C590B1|nr:centrosomal protein of 104 kDa-like isoform X2 [Eriocheir sinensis]